MQGVEWVRSSKLVSGLNNLFEKDLKGGPLGGPSGDRSRSVQASLREQEYPIGGYRGQVEWALAGLLGRGIRDLESSSQGKGGPPLSRTAPTSEDDSAKPAEWRHGNPANSMNPSPREGQSRAGIIVDLWQLNRSSR
jgi:hypothetical protein